MVSIVRDLIHDVITSQAMLSPAAPALRAGSRGLSYAELATEVERFAGALVAVGVEPGDRIAVYLPKRSETVVALLGAAAAGGCFVPVNPVLKPAQVRYILEDAGVRVLVTSESRWQGLQTMEIPRAMQHLILVQNDAPEPAAPIESRSNGPMTHNWKSLCDGPKRPAHRRIDKDIAAILYTSGSSGQPKGVVLSHRNLVAGAASVAEYLNHSPDDRLLALLPLSFDAGLSQLTTAFVAGASVVLQDYLLPQDALRTLCQYRITGLTAVPTLWLQLLKQQWPEDIAATLRYVANTGGAMPEWATRELTSRLPRTSVFLMYGLTEAFRSTYLPPEEVARRPTSIGRAIPNTEILVVNERGSICKDNEPGELVHRGALVAMGYWNDPARTTERFRAAPRQCAGLPESDIAVWSGDRVVRDSDGFLYFLGRSDAMIKTSGYRVSPGEVESVAHASGLVEEAAALGVAHARLGQGILLLAVGVDDSLSDETEWVKALQQHLRRELPAFMQPAGIVPRRNLPTTPNGKVDRVRLAREYAEYFSGEQA